MTKLIFINENENVFEALSDQNISINFSVKEHLKIISAKANNNYIGYYQFLENKVYYKIYILPKITPRVENNEINKKNFIYLLSKYYQLKNKYSHISFKRLGKNIVDFSIENKKEQKQSDKLDDFITYKYNDALQDIESFFKRYKNFLVKERKFYAQTIKHKFNIKQNILEINKSKIHQQKKEPYLYSKLAVISVEVLRYFLKYKVKSRKAKKIKNKIEAKYNFNSYNFKPREICSKKVKSFFKSSDEKGLYIALLTLLGIESYFENNSYVDMLKLHNQHTHFFRPEKLFEWQVYDYLLKNSEFTELYYEGIHSKQTKKEFSLDSERHSEKYSSNPDLIAEKGNEKFIVDAKWKVLNKPNEDDIHKLARDAEIRGVNKGILIYPKQLEDSKFELNLSYFRSYNKNFSFQLKVINLNEDETAVIENNI